MESTSTLVNAAKAQVFELEVEDRKLQIENGTTIKEVFV